MVNLTIPQEDLIATLEAQRNEAWNAAARAGAACAAAMREIESRDARIGELEVQCEALCVELAKVRTNDKPGDSEPQVLMDRG